MAETGAAPRSRREIADASGPGLARNALSPFEVISATLANLAPVEGIFLSITLVAAAMGTRAPWAFLIAGVAIAATGNTMAEFSKRVPSAGSFVSFIGRGLGQLSPAGGNFLAAAAFYMLLISYPVTLAAVVIFLGSWVQIVFSLSNIAWLLVSLGVVAVATPLLLRKVGLSAEVAFAMFAIEAIGLLVLSIALLIRSGSHVSSIVHSIGGSPGLHGLSGITFALAVSGFIGWENSGPLAEEAREPRRAIPRAIFTSIAVIMLLYFLASWGAASAFIAWKGPAQGAQALANLNDAAPFLTLSRHYTPWWTWAVDIIGVTSAFGCCIAAVTSDVRITYNTAREGLLPPIMARVTRRTQAPISAIVFYIAVLVALIVLSYLLVSKSAITDFSDLAGVGTVPILLVYLIANLSLAPYIRRRHPESFSWLRHVLVPLVGSAVLAYGIYQFVLPTQPPPANHYWIFILIIVAGSAIAAALVSALRPAAVRGIGTITAE